MCRYAVRILPVCCPDVSEIGVRMLPKYPVKDEKGQLKAADLVSRFSIHYGFNIKFCNPNSGHEKGNVENKVGTIRRNLFVPEPVIEDLDSFNTSLLAKCDKRLSQLHYLLKEPIEKLFEQEKALMKPVTKIPFDAARYETRKVNKYGLIEFSSCRYSVSPKYVGQYVTLKIMANQIAIYSKDMLKRIDVHPRMFGKGKESIHYINFIDIIKTRPNALKYSGIYNLLPISWQEYLQSLDKEELRKSFSILKMILRERDMNFADQVLKETIKHESISSAAIYITFKRLKENRLVYSTAMEFPSDLPSYEVNMKQYDTLMKGDFQ